MTTLTLQQDTVDLQGTFTRQGWVYLPGFVSTEQAAAWERETRQLAGKSLCCKVKTIRWTEQSISEGHELERWANSSPVKRFMRNVDPTAAPDLTCRSLWISRYKDGEFIEPHRDAGGHIQLLVCFAANPAQGGKFYLVANDGEPHGLDLLPGDAVVYRATQVTHWTQPFNTTGSQATPERAILDARYYQQVAD